MTWLFNTANVGDSVVVIETNKDVWKSAITEVTARQIKVKSKKGRKTYQRFNRKTGFLHKSHRNKTYADNPFAHRRIEPVWLDT